MDVRSYDPCNQCPRNCGASRTGNGTRSGFCKESAELRAASACLHFGEEPPITVFGGSGTVFITGCNLRCAFCQNYQISQHGMGKALSRQDFVRICLTLQERGAENINIVTGSHAVPQLADGIAAAKREGLTIPVCWNSSAYEKPETLDLLAGLVDIWLPDLKTVNAEVGKSVFKAADYPQKARHAILRMLELSPLKEITVHQNGGEARTKLLSGVIIRHLFLPGRLDDTIITLDWLKKHADGKAYVSLMSQYTPVPFKETAAEAGERQAALSVLENRLVNAREFADLQDILAAYDFEYLFYQELEANTEWLPDFDREQPFSASIAKPVWHWKTGFIGEMQPD
ncbi:radical SAM protein [Treponema brennaborense]|uniref:Radical SAM domain protein n=1 Tax=Treponema brennaborense (strain DSM 12168 / CIP 105900 / DD5/3) TaxID=906968 RepID=F4LL59_TREBD|nr:radical SAM protein [Treponema brennaborense]AEE17633.1 Radical SAM domain protein [Treponema brennaborense DSM 12168]